MKAAITKEMGGKVTGAFVLIMSMLFSIYALDAYPQTVEEYINSGEQKLYTESINKAMEAYGIFIAAKIEYPNDPVINAYLAFTRMLYYAFSEDPMGVESLLGQWRDICQPQTANREKRKRGQEIVWLKQTKNPLLRNIIQNKIRGDSNNYE
jgi:hypothetical protein